MDDLESRLDTMKRELDALQIHVMKDKVPWYRQLPLVVSLAVSVLALAFSFWTYNQSENRIERQDRHAARAELRGLIQRLESLPREIFDVEQKYKDNPDARTRLTAALASERHIVAQQAVELVYQLEGDVTAAEYYAVVNTFIRANQEAGLQDLIEDGLGVADDALSEVTLLRQSGSIYFDHSDVAEGRARYGRALKVFDKYPGHTESFIGFVNGITHAFWARQEGFARNCDEAWRQIAFARQLIGDEDLAVVDASTKIEAHCGSEDRTEAPG